MEDCIFCKIVKGEIPCHKVYEDDNFLGFLDVRPMNPGHVLLIPKKHYQWVDDYEPYCEYWETARRLSKAVKKAMDCNLVSYVVYGLGVPHAHIHLIPKFEGDQHPLGPNPEKTVELSEQEMKDIAKKISSAIK